MGERISPRRVLVAMRHNSERLLYGDMLERDGFVIARAGSIAEARAHLESGHPDILVLGLDDFNGEGRDLVAWIRSEWGRDIRIVGISASPEGVRAGLADGCDQCLQMPMPMSEVVAAVRTPSLSLVHRDAALIR